MLRKILLLLSLIFITALNARIQPHIDPDLIREATTPIFTKTSFIITLPPETGYQIFIRSDIDNWKNNYYFKKSFSGIYYCEIPYNYECKSIKYRLNINGFWETNQWAVKYIRMILAMIFSVAIPRGDLFARYYQFLLQLQIWGYLKFRVFNPDAQQINLVISADKFNRFKNVLHKLDNGYWEINLLLKEGLYTYYYMVDGKKVIDEFNPRLITDAALGSLSVLDAKKK